MKDYWNMLKQAYILSNKKRTEKAESLFTEVFNDIKDMDYWKDHELKDNYVNSIIWLWELNMKAWNFDKALKLYNLWKTLTKNKDFWILFNLAVLYKTTGDMKSAKKYVLKAKKLNPEDQNIIRFITEHSEELWINSAEETLENKIANIIKKLKL